MSTEYWLLCFSFFFSSHISSTRQSGRNRRRDAAIRSSKIFNKFLDFVFDVLGEPIRACAFPIQAWIVQKRVFAVVDTNELLIHAQHDRTHTHAIKCIQGTISCTGQANHHHQQQSRGKINNHTNYIATVCRD